jgi:hypothetical protein
MAKFKYLYKENNMTILLTSKSRLEVKQRKSPSESWELMFRIWYQKGVYWVYNAVDNKNHKFTVQQNLVNCMNGYKVPLDISMVEAMDAKLVMDVVSLFK